VSRASPWQFYAAPRPANARADLKVAALLFRSHSFGDVAASARNTNGLSFFIMKSLPALLENFDAAIRHNDPILDRARRALAEGRDKGCIHFRAFLRMNEFTELCARGGGNETDQSQRCGVSALTKSRSSSATQLPNFPFSPPS